MEIIFRNVHLSFQEYAAINLKYSLLHQKSRLLRILFFIVLAVGLQIYFQNHTPTRGYEGQSQYSFSTDYLWVIGLSIILFLALLLFSIRRGLRKRYNATQFLQTPASYTFTDAGISINAPNVQGLSSWDTIKSLLSMKEFALLTTQNFTVYFLDFRCLEAPATEADFLALLKQHNIPVK